MGQYQNSLRKEENLHVQAEQERSSFAIPFVRQMLSHFQRSRASYVNSYLGREQPQQQTPPDPAAPHFAAAMYAASQSSAYVCIMYISRSQLGTWFCFGLIHCQRSWRTHGVNGNCAVHLAQSDLWSCGSRSAHLSSKDTGPPKKHKDKIREQFRK